MKPQEAGFHKYMHSKAAPLTMPTIFHSIPLATLLCMEHWIQRFEDWINKPTSGLKLEHMQN